jgi:DNA-binding response OmpR family regulator
MKDMFAPHLQVLLVDDSAAFADVLLTTLQFIGVHADHARSGEEALDVLNTYRPHLMLLDLNLPGMTDWQVLKYARDKYRPSGIPVIITSAYSDAVNQMMAELQCVSHYLVKPFTPRELYIAVNEALESHRTNV